MSPINFNYCTRRVNVPSKLESGIRYMAYISLTSFWLIDWLRLNCKHFMGKAIASLDLHNVCTIVTYIRETQRNNFSQSRWLSKWNILPSRKASSMYHLFDVHTFLNLTKRVCVLSTYLHSLLNNVWYVSVPNLIPLRRPSGVSLLLLSNCRAFKSLIVIHLNIALQRENTTDHWIQIS